VTEIRGQKKYVRKLMRNFFFGLSLSAILLALCLSTEAQQPKKVPRIGYLSTNGDPSNPPPFVEVFRQGLRDLGYVEGKNIQVEYRYAEGKLERVQAS
jgi:putative ABC transport system substrate-binding protein